MTLRKVTIDLHKEIDKLEDEIAEKEKVLDNLVEQFNEEFGEDGEPASYSDVPDAERKNFEKVEDEVTDLEGTRDRLEESIEDYGGGSYRIRELPGSALAAIQDVVAEQSYEFDHEQGEIVDGVPKSGLGMVETLERSIIDQPPEAPTRVEEGTQVPAPGQYPHQLMLFLHEKVNNFNAVGEVEVKNSSLKDRMS